jgi:predicted transcriptional regulator
VGGHDTELINAIGLLSKIPRNPGRHRSHLLTNGGRLSDDFESVPVPAKLESMELNVPADLQTKLARAADRRGIAAEALALEAIERAVEYDDWFLREVEKGLAQIERGEVLTHAEVGARLEGRLTKQQHRP